MSYIRMQTTVRTASRPSAHSGPAPAVLRQLCLNQDSTAGHRRTSRTVSAIMNKFKSLVPCVSGSNSSSISLRAEHSSKKVRCLLLQHHTGHIISLDDILALKDDAPGMIIIYHRGLWIFGHLPVKPQHMPLSGLHLFVHIHPEEYSNVLFSAGFLLLSLGDDAEQECAADTLQVCCCCQGVSLQGETRIMITKHTDDSNAMVVWQGSRREKELAAPTCV